MSHPPQMTPDDVRRAIDAALAGGVVEIWDHCKNQMRARGADVFDVRRCLGNGTVGRAQWHDDYQHWRYRIEGFDIEGEDLIAITVVVRMGFIGVVTIF